MSGDMGDGRAPGVRRDARGRFTNSGNPAGRPVRIERDPRLPASRRDAIFRVADRKVPVNIEGKVETMTIFEANILRLGTAGAAGNRIAAKDFLQITMLASDVDLEKRVTTTMLIDRMNRIESENEDLRREVGQARTGPLHLSPEEWERFLEMRERRSDDGLMDELRDNVEQARQDEEGARRAGQGDQD